MTAADPASLTAAAPVRLRASAAVLMVRDVIRSAEYYRDVLGFAFERYWGEPPCFVMLYRDELCLMLKQALPPQQVLPNGVGAEREWNVYFWVTQADSLHAEFLQRGASIACPICDQPHGCREFVIEDPDGYRIAFGAVLKA